MSRAALLGLVASMTVAGSVAAAPINTLQDVLATTNLYVLGNLGDSAGDRYGSSSEGRVIVGGNAFTSGFAYGSSLNSTSLALVVGGNLNTVGGSIKGSAEVGGNATLKSFNVQGGLTVGGNAQLTTGSVNGALSVGGNTSRSGVSVGSTGAATPSAAASIAATSGDLKSAADTLGALTANGSAQVQWGNQLVLTGTDATLNVFSLTAAQVANLSKIRIDAPTGSTVLVNVAGKTVAFDTSFGFEFVGVSSNDLLFNLYDAESVSMASLSGSLLAPDATVSFARGAVEGSAIVGNLSNGSGTGGVFHNDPFTGTLTSVAAPVTDVPEPGTLVILSSVLAIFAWARRRSIARAPVRRPGQ